MLKNGLGDVFQNIYVLVKWMSNYTGGGYRPLVTLTSHTYSHLALIFQGIILAIEKAGLVFWTGNCNFKVYM